LKPLTIHLEGGPERGGKSDLSEIRAAFHSFFGVYPSVKIVPWGPRRRAFEKFVEALESEPDREHLLLVDSEAPLKENKTRWMHVRDRDGDGWKKPKAVSEDHLHFMAQCIEAWLVADKSALQSFYGSKLGSLRDTDNVEEIPKEELMKNLATATRRTEKGEYHKTQHFPMILKTANRGTVAIRAPHLGKLLTHLREMGYISGVGS
jgi:hypothetical protein